MKNWINNFSFILAGLAALLLIPLALIYGLVSRPFSGKQKAQRQYAGYENADVIVSPDADIWPELKVTAPRRIPVRYYELSRN